MAISKQYKKLNSKIEKLYEKLKFKAEIFSLDKRILKEKIDKKVAKFERKEKPKLYEIEFSLSNCAARTLSFSSLAILYNLE